MGKLQSSKTVWLALAFCAALAIGSQAQTLTTLANFDGPHGSMPMRISLVQDAVGNFYGTTERGGDSDHGTVFKMAPDGTLTLLYSFTNQADGTNPDAGLVLASDGNFYGTTRAGGAHSGIGTIFRITPQGTLTTIHTFVGTDGSGVYAPLMQATDGNLYGTTFMGGANGKGTIFKITLDGTLTTLYNFCPQVSCPDGASSLAGLVQGSDGNFYGTTQQGGTGGYGVVYKITSDGTYTTLHSFDFNSEGSGPRDRLVQASDLNLYGTTYLGGAADSGTVFKITPGGTLTVLFHFCNQLDCSGGMSPESGLIQASDGNFYGTSTGGGDHGHGTVFKMTPSGSLTALYSFCGETNCVDGNGALGTLLQANDGNFYGTTEGGGTHNDGTVYRVTGPPLIATTTVLTTTPNPSHLGQSVAMTATVTAHDGSTPTGNVLFQSDGMSIGTAALVSGVAVLNYSSLPLGTHSIVAIYQGGGGYAGSTSNTVQQVVALTASTTAVTSTPNPSTFGQGVTITATVGPAGPPTPTGTVSFTLYGGAIAGCTDVPLMANQALCMTASLPTGTDLIAATYSGDSNYSGSSGMLTQIVNPVPSPVQFVAVTPCRVVDTRNPDGDFGGPAIPGHSSRDFPLSRNDNPCGIPTTAVAYSLNVTVVPSGRLGYLTIWPTGQGQPSVSLMNSLDGRVKANAAIIPAGAPDGRVSVYVTDTTNVVLDIDGYFISTGAPGSPTTLQFYPLTPCRVVDTRNPNGHLGGPFLSQGAERDFPVPESSCIPQGVSPAAYSFNITVAPHPAGQRLGFLTVWPAGEQQPTVSTLNNPTGTNVANAAIVPAGSNGAIAVYPNNTTDLIVDINGYFAAPGSGGLSLYTLTPCRVLDTRNLGNGNPFQGELTVNVVDSACGPPTTAQAFVFNATVVPPGHLGYLTLWPDGEDQPVVSTLNATDGAITSNMAIVPTNNGSIDAYASALTQLILDISSYFAP